MGEILIGCSGFSYDDWVGPFYPAGTPKARFLEYYAERFSILELNASYYRIPAPWTVAGWVKRTPESFRFVMKANKLLTHETDDPASPAAVEEFRRCLEPLVEADRLAGVLLQFPQRFRPSDAARELLERRIAELGNYPLVCEFRHREWLRESVAGWLERRGVGWCCVDEPDLPDLMHAEERVTSSVGYVRFHGRNAAKWYQHEEAWERYNYLYSEAELREWVPRVRRMAEKAEQVVVFMNNHRDGQAPQNAATFRELLEWEG